ncbi:MAG: carboxymuconolactone decarboxylase family protein [Hyphomonadaceae bacterium]|nr:carboxymuconolactone decarboxylase family protein [Hyphomonadaceae bacterium]MBX3511471.1 carboxymuconolactone decarboxylase family protein [Hyphomonadaceae bacterium]
MAFDALRDTLPDYAKDIKLNLGSLASDQSLSEQQKWGAFLACAYATGAPALIRALEAETEARLTPEAKNGAKAAAAIMGMNNVYYRSVHLLKNEEYRTLRAGLRMNVIANPGVDKGDFELWSLAVSAVNGCGMCLDSHEEELRKRSFTSTQVQTALRIAAVVNAAAAVLRAEAALAA